MSASGSQLASRHQTTASKRQSGKHQPFAEQSVDAEEHKLFGSTSHGKSSKTLSYSKGHSTEDKEGEGSKEGEEIEWELRDSRLTDYRDGSVVFEQTDVEVPSSWSQNATNILAQKYFRGVLNTPERETSLKQVVGRIVSRIASWGDDGGYFKGKRETDAFIADLTHLLYTQKAAFNSPVWFNIGVDGVPQQASACFILSVDDTIESIMEWYAEEALIFKGGSGSGVNLSNIRASSELLTGGGIASGPVSFMRGADASAGAVKSGGKTRRAAKMVILDADHPDISEFVFCKAREERKSRALAAAGFDMGINGVDAMSIQYQNANNSVRVTDDFMHAVINDDTWNLKARIDGSVVETIPARDLMRQIAEAAWECADPGMQFHTTINRWHTAVADGDIVASNPCSEYMHLNDSACNLASINLLHFLGSDGMFDIDGFRHAVRVVFTAQEILVGRADYPTEKIKATSNAFRQLGLGYANLGALLMALGLPYDSDEGRAVAASITALMTGEAYCVSAQIAARLGPFSGYSKNREHMLDVLHMHKQAVESIDSDLAPVELLETARQVWREANDLAAAHGVRNSQATVLAPTGTIGLLMDCDTTGIEPDLALVKHKRLVGGGMMEIVNQTIPRALNRLGYSAEQTDAILSHIAEHRSVVNAPMLAEHKRVFDCSLGEAAISCEGHVMMMGAVQPFLSGAISKTVNMPEEATVEDVEELFITSWKLGLKAVAIYRDNCKVDQPLNAGVSKNGDASSSGDSDASNVEVSSGYSGMHTQVPSNGNMLPVVAHAAVNAAPHAPAHAVAHAPTAPVRERLPRVRQSKTFEFRVADCKGFVTVGEYDDGRPGEIFVNVSKQGSTLAGIMDAFAISLSHGLQYGVPMIAFCKAFVGMRFEPEGITDDPEIRIANSLMDYLFRRFAIMYLTSDERVSLGIYTTDERIQQTLPGVEEKATRTVQGADFPAHSQSAPICMDCGVTMQRAGSCYLCISCGNTSGCS